MAHERVRRASVHASFTKIDEKAILIYLLVFERKELQLEADQERRAWMQAEDREQSEGW
jgi:hypothetical protein